MTDHATETYEEWRERTKPRPSGHVSWWSWIGIGVGLLLIFPGGAVFVGCLVVGTSLAEPITVLVRVSSEKAKMLVGVAWTTVWVVGSIVLLVRTGDHDWVWWLILAMVPLLIAGEVRRVVTYENATRSEPGSLGHPDLPR